MLNFVGIKKNSAFIFYVGLTSQADVKLLQVNPSISAGDFKVSIDGGAFADLATLPVVTPAGGRSVKITLSAAEMNGTNIFVQCVDAAGAQWCDLPINIQTTPVDASLVQIDGTVLTAATLNLKQLNVINSGGDAAVFQSTGGNGHGIFTLGNGSGSGVAALGGTTGHGYLGEGGPTSGSGAFLQAVGSGNGLSAYGAGGSFGIFAVGDGAGSGIGGFGGNTGHGAVYAGGAASGFGVLATAGGNGVGISAVGVGGVSILATQGISGPFDASTYNAIADAALVRDWTITDTSTAPNSCTINALRSLRNWAVSGATYTVYKENGTTQAWTATLTTDATAIGVVALDSN